MFLALQWPGAAAPDQPSYVQGELLVKFKGGPRGEAAAKAQRAFQHKVKRRFDPIGWQHIELPPGQTVEEALARYRKHPDVLAVEPNYLRQLAPMSPSTNVTPNDPEFWRQWGLVKIGATNAWATTTGSGDVVIAVIDSGVLYTHQDLAANMWRNPGETGLDAQGNDKATNGFDDDDNDVVDDVYGIDVVDGDGDPRDGMSGAYYHGTACAGVIGAVGNNGIGIAGVNWSVRLMGVRYLSATGAGVTDAMFAEACMYLVRMKSNGVNLRVTSHSYGPGPPSYANLPSVVERDAIQSLGDAGILSVFAVGPAGRDLDVAQNVFPACYHLPSMVNVTASDQQDRRAGTSSWGATNVDLAAPGAGIYTTGGPNDTSYYTLDGTSMSCPYVAGAAALLAAAYPFANAGQIKTALLQAVDPLAAFNGLVASGGRLNLAEALQHAGLPTNAPPFILLQPRSLSVGQGDTATFQVTASGPSSSPLAFQWRHEGADLGDATNATLTLPNVSTNDSGEYRVVVTNDFGMVTSAVVTLSVAVCPVILWQSPSVRVLDDAEVSLSVVVVGAAPMSFQWRHDGTNVPGATNSTFLLTGARPSDSGNYEAVIVNACGSVTSAVPTVVTVLGRPWIVAQPHSLTVTQGANVALCVTVTNTATLPVGVLWRRNARNLGFTGLTNGFTACTNLPNIQGTNAGVWAAWITNAATALSGTIRSSDAYVTVVVPPTNQGVCAGDSVTFRASAAGTNLSYQWQFDGTDLTNGLKYSGATTTNLTILSVLASDAGEYTFVVRNPAGEPTGFPVRLDVPCPGLTTRLVPCELAPDQQCVEICWPDGGSAWILEWTGNLDEPQPDWQPWLGPVSNEPGRKCVRTPIDRSTIFFRLRRL